MHLAIGKETHSERSMDQKYQSLYANLCILSIYALIILQATVALAGFPIGETYHVPWAHVEVPTSLQRSVFPFCEEVIARLRAEGHDNRGTFGFLELLQNLRPFFWMVSLLFHSISSCINQDLSHTGCISNPNAIPIIFAEKSGYIET